LVLSGLMVSRRRKRQGKCAYSTRANVQYTSEPLDVVAEVKSQKVRGRERETDFHHNLLQYKCI
jgi:hypothetical protein